MNVEQIKHYEAKIDQLNEKIAALESKLLETEACCAKMRQALRAEIDTHGHVHWDATMQHGRGCPLCIRQGTALMNSNKALAPDCGKALLEKLARYERALHQLARLGNGPNLGNSKGNDIAIQALQLLPP